MPSPVAPAPRGRPAACIAGGLALAAALGLAACTRPPASSKPKGAAEPALSNRIELGPDVIRSLGITFAKAESGRLEERLRVPGRLEVAPGGRSEVRAPAAGRVRLRKTRLDRVAAGEEVAALATPDLREAQEALFAAEAAHDEASLALAAHDAEAPAQVGMLRALEDEVAEVDEQIAHATRLVTEAHALEREARARLAALEALPPGSTMAAGERLAARRDAVEAYARELELGLRMEELRAHAAETRLATARQGALVAGFETRRGALVRAQDAARLARRQGLGALAALTGEDEAALATPHGASDTAGVPRWRTLETLPLRASRAGVLVETPVADGAWVEASSLVALVLDTSTLAFRGQLPEGDLGRIPARAPVRIEPAGRGRMPIESTLVETLPLANALARTILIEAPVPNPSGHLPDGLSATAFVLLGVSGGEEVLVPEACVVRSNLESVLFRRDPARPEFVIRTVVGTGRRGDGRIEVLSGLMAGDEVVREGVHQLKLLGGAAPKGGHVHADGTFHEDHGDGGEGGP